MLKKVWEDLMKHGLNMSKFEGNLLQLYGNVIKN